MSFLGELSLCVVRANGPSGINRGMGDTDSTTVKNGVSAGNVLFLFLWLNRFVFVWMRFIDSDFGSLQAFPEAGVAGHVQLLLRRFILADLGFGGESIPTPTFQDLLQYSHWKVMEWKRKEGLVWEALKSVRFTFMCTSKLLSALCFVHFTVGLKLSIDPSGQEKQQ